MVTDETPSEPTAEPGIADDLASTDQSTEQTTEWFATEEDWAPEEEFLLPARNHFVTAVVVAHDGAVWLPAVLTTLSQQTRPVEAVVGVDNASTDSSLAILRDSLGADRIVHQDRDSGFGAAVAVGLAHVRVPELPADWVEWVWLLHDDSAADPSCLQALLRTADANPSVAVLGPKILGWHDRRLLLEVGVSVTADGRRVTGLERREHDQGQHDGARDVMAVSSAGMLVRRDVWDALNGFDPQLPLFRDDLDFCWRVHRMGERVMVATDAVMHHREASAHGRRVATENPHQEDREAAVHVLLAQNTGVVGFFLGLRLLAGSMMRSLIYLLGKDISAARQESAAVLVVLARPRRLRSSRQLIAVTSTEPASVTRALRPSTLDQLRSVLENAAAFLSTSSSTAAMSSVSGLESGPGGDDADYLANETGGWVRRIFWRPSVLVTMLLAVIAVIATRSLWWGDGVIQGGALLPSLPGAGDLWSTYLRAWHDVGMGSTVAMPSYLAVLAGIATVLLGKASWAIAVVLLLAVPIAGWSLYFATRGFIDSKPVRIWMATAYALLPAMTGAVEQGRIGTTMAAVITPFVIRSCVRIARPQGTMRRAAGTALLLGILLAVAPGLWLIALVLAVIAAAYLFTTTGSAATQVVIRFTIALVGSVLVTAPWSLQLFAHPVLFLLGPGVNSPALGDPNLRAIDVLLLHPGGPGMTPLWISIGIVLAGFIALFRMDRLRIVVACWVVAIAALALGVLQTMVLVTPPGTTTPMRTWPGPATLLLGLALIAAAGVAAQGLRNRFVGQSLSWGQPVAAITVVAAVLAPILSAGWWIPATDDVVKRAPLAAVPAFVAADALGPQAPRTLVLFDTKAGKVLYSLINGEGPVLGDADVSPPAENWVALDPIVAALASGRGGTEVQALAGYGVRYVLLARGTSPELIPVLDGEPGLRRLSSADESVIWRIAGQTARARVVQGEAPVAIDLVDIAGASVDPYIDSVLPPGDGERALVLGTPPDSGWRAVSVDPATDQQVALPTVQAPEPEAWSQSFLIPAGAQPVTVTFDTGARDRWLWFQLFVFLTLVVLALPQRRVLDPDPDDDGELVIFSEGVKSSEAS
jgi:GT2 family glycosyltransferase